MSECISPEGHLLGTDRRGHILCLRDACDFRLSASETIAIINQHASLQVEVERFPMQDGPPITIRTAKIIYAIYSDLFGTEQSLERLAERGGFGWAEVQTITKEFIRKRGQSAYGTLLQKEGER